VPMGGFERIPTLSISRGKMSSSAGEDVRRFGTNNKQKEPWGGSEGKTELQWTKERPKLQGQKKKIADFAGRRERVKGDDMKKDKGHKAKGGGKLDDFKRFGRKYQQGKKIRKRFTEGAFARETFSRVTNLKPQSFWGWDNFVSKVSAI